HDGQFAPEDSLEIHAAGLGMDADDNDRPTNLRERYCQRYAAGGARHLEHDVRTCAAGPLVEPRRIVEVFGMQGDEAEVRCECSTRRVELDDSDVAADMPSDGRDDQPNRPTTHHNDLVTGRHAPAPYVVHGDSDWLDERRFSQSRVFRHSDERRRGHVPQWL